jgi:hypothetical protein
MLTQLITNFQLTRNYEITIKYATKYAGDKSSEIRNAALQLLSTVSSAVGYHHVQPFLKKLHPQILKSIEERFPQNKAATERAPLADKSSNLASTIPITNRNEGMEMPYWNHLYLPSPNSSTNPAYLCSFCGKFDIEFANDDYRDWHLYNSCPMLLLCLHCGQIVEISLYTTHLLTACDES